MNKTIYTSYGNFVTIPKGSSVMGNSSSFSTYIGIIRKEHLQAQKEHQVEIDLNFAVLETPVTISQYLEYRKDNIGNLKQIEYSVLSNKSDLEEYCDTDKTEYEFNIQWSKKKIYDLVADEKMANFPMVGVTHQDSIDYANWLGNRIGHKTRLLTEAEWEYCCRASTNTTFYWGNNIKNVSDYAWCCINSKLNTKEIKQLKPNNWGLYDMVGNVWEWCLDNYDENYYEISPTSNPLCIDKTNDKCVIRGGSAFNKAETCRSTHRFGLKSSTRNEYLGFRLLIEQ